MAHCFLLFLLTKPHDGWRTPRFFLSRWPIAICPFFARGLCLTESVLDRTNTYCRFNLKQTQRIHINKNSSLWNFFLLAEGKQFR
jgi:hypothetical protein